MNFNFSGSYNVADAEQSQHTFYVNTIVCNVWLLDGTCVSFKVDKHCRGQGLLDLTFDYLELLERDFFGLVFNFTHATDVPLLKWVDPSKKICKQFKADPPFTFWFRVKFYVPNPICLHEEYTRYQFFLQVRKDIVEGRLPVSKSSAAHLAGLALQSELGDYSAEDCRPGYVSQFRFVPQQTPEFESQASEWHRKSTSMLPSAAELEYLNVARHLERYGTKTQEALDESEGLSPILLGVSFVGITVFRTNKPNTQFPWDNVLRIQFRSKKFTVHLKTPAMTVLPMNGSVSALNRTGSAVTLANPGAQSTVTSLSHTYRFSSALLAKSFWQYAVACHAFFRVREPTADARTGLRNNLTGIANGGTTSISATALYAAITRATGGFRRYFSLVRRGSVATMELGAPVGGVGRTLSTVMELRRNSRVFDRGFTRTSSRPSNRRSVMSSTLNVTFAPSSGMRTASNASLVDPALAPSLTGSNTLPVKSYAQMPPPPGVRASYAGKHSGLRSADIGSATSRYSSMSAVTSKQQKRGTAAGTATSIPSSLTASYHQSHQSQPETTAVISRGQSTHPDKSSRVRGSKQAQGSSPTAASTDRVGSQRWTGGSSPAPNHGDAISPKSVRRNAETRSVDKFRHSPSPHDVRDDAADFSGSDLTDQEHGCGDATDFDQQEAARYWHGRRAQAVRVPSTRTQSSASGRNRTNSTGSHQPQDTASKRRPVTESATAVELPPGTEMVYKTGFSRLTSIRPRPQPPGSMKKPTTEPAVVQRKEPLTSAAVPSNNDNNSHTPSPSPGFVKDPFHPGAPASELTTSSGLGTATAGGDAAGADSTGLIRIRIRPDSHGRFGFNVRGGADHHGAPIIVSRVGANMPADLCIPRLSEGDQLCSINGRDVAGCTHAQVVSLIRAASEDRSGVLELLVRPSDYVLDDWNNGEQVQDSGDAPPLPPRAAHSSIRSSSSFALEPSLSGSFRRLVNPGTTTLTPLSGSDAPDIQNNHRQSEHGSLSGRSSLLDANPLLQSMLELEAGLADGSILTQFEQLPRKKPGFTTNASRLHENVMKNRYRDISPYDQTRVILRQGAGDYINANFVSMDFPKAGFALRYIAAQGPLPSTYGDFWQMCWEQNVTVVVMLTAISERGRVKCHQYWPNVGQTLNFTASQTSPIPFKPNAQRVALELQLQTVREEVTADFAFREFQISPRSQTKQAPVRTSVGGTTRRIVQLQYISWPDHGVPGNTDDLINFVARVRQARAPGPRAPIVVHCSAGIGRTGVLITMETALNLMERDQAIRPLELVQQMRAQRALLIQTTSQFQFVCETILKVFQRDHAVKLLK